MQLKNGCKGLWIAIAALAADQISKYAAVAALSPNGRIVAIPGVLSWSYYQNTGASFSLFTGRSLLLAALTCALVGMIVGWLVRHPACPKLTRIGFWLIAGGGIGNLIDRLARGFVVDFVQLDFVDFAVFNVADSCICIGAVLVLIAGFMAQKRPAAS